MSLGEFHFFRILDGLSLIIHVTCVAAGIASMVKSLVGGRQALCEECSRPGSAGEFTLCPSGKQEGQNRVVGDGQADFTAVHGTVDHRLSSLGDTPGTINVTVPRRESCRAVVA